MRHNHRRLLRLVCILKNFVWKLHMYDKTASAQNGLKIWSIGHTFQGNLLRSRMKEVKQPSSKGLVVSAIKSHSRYEHAESLVRGILAVVYLGQMSVYFDAASTSLSSASWSSLASAAFFKRRRTPTGPSFSTMLNATTFFSSLGWSDLKTVKF